jgi:hypothetical protein
MTEVPKIVYDRLRAARPERTWPEQTGTELAHPDADLLTAFAEQALSVTERDGVLQHLALCGDCRETVALALPAVDGVAAPIADGVGAVRAAVSRAGAPHRLVFGWPHLRWAAVAAAVVVVASVLLVRPGKLNQAKPTSVSPQMATNLPPAPGPRIASSPVASPMAALSTDQPAVAARTNAARPKSELRSSKRLKAGQVVTPSLPAESGMLLAENKIADNKKDSREADKAPAPPSTGAVVLDYNASAIPRSNETVEVTAESPTVQAEVSSEDRVMARNNARAIAKAKPAPQIETSQQQNTISAAVSELPLQGRNVVSMAQLAAAPSPTRARPVAWTIAAGVLQRSLDSGQSWQDALHADHPLLCYASHDQDVWTGGQAGTLFHSADSGATWVQVQPSIKAQQLSSDVTHIDLRSDVRGNVRSSAQIIVSTSNNEIWSSADGGKTWQKK